MSKIDKVVYVYITYGDSNPCIKIETGLYYPYVTSHVYTGSPPYPLEAFVRPENETLYKMGFSLMLGLVRFDSFSYPDDKKTMLAVYTKPFGNNVKMVIDEEKLSPAIVRDHYISMPLQSIKKDDLMKDKKQQADMARLVLKAMFGELKIKKPA